MNGLVKFWAWASGWSCAFAFAIFYEGNRAGYGVACLAIGLILGTAAALTPIETEAK
jgi:hypothetical protein